MSRRTRVPTLLSWALTPPARPRATCPQRSIMFYSIRAVQSSPCGAATDRGASFPVPLLERTIDENLKSQIGLPYLVHISDLGRISFDLYSTVRKHIGMIAQRQG